MEKSASGVTMSAPPSIPVVGSGMSVPCWLEKGAFPPKYMTRESAGFDLAYREGPDIIANPGMIVMVPTGIHVAIPAGYEIQIRPRSGMAGKNGITIVNSPGTIDSDYRGEIMLPVINHGTSVFTISSGMRIAQGVLKQVPRAVFLSMPTLEDLGQTERGMGGIGHTGGVYESEGGDKAGNTD